MERRERVEGYERNYSGGGTQASKLKRILKGKVRDKTFGKYGDLREVQEEKEVQECKARHNKKNNRWAVRRKENKSS